MLFRSVVLEKAGAYSLAILAGGNLGYKLGSDSSFTDTGLTLSAGSWNHLALVSDGTNVSVHLNGGGGSKTSSMARAVTLGATSSSLLIGKGASAAGLAGGIADVRVWSAALSQATISANYRSTTLPSETNLVGYWDLREVSGTTANDRSNSSNSGTLSGFSSTIRTAEIGRAHV